MLTCFNPTILNITHLTIKKFIEFYSNKYKIQLLPLKKYMKKLKCSSNEYIVSDKFLDIKNFGYYKLFYKSEKKFLKLDDERHPYAMIKKKYITNIDDFKKYLRSPLPYIQYNYINRLKQLAKHTKISLLNNKTLLILTIPYKLTNQQKIKKKKFLKLLKQKYKKITRKKTVKNYYYSEIYHKKEENIDFFKIN